ncbi:MAG: beta-ketoacyl-[acyl-carrier-protein] synthase family protein [Pseudomonadota bacterium]
MHHEVLVTGYGLVAPGAMDASTLFRRIAQQGSGLRANPRFQRLGFINTAAGYIDEEQWARIHVATAKLPDITPPQVRLAEFVMLSALVSAGLTVDDFRHMKSGLFLGSNKFCANNRDFAVLCACLDFDGLFDLDRFLTEQAPTSHPFARRVDQQTHHLAALLGVADHVSTHADACAAGTVAIGTAFRSIQRGDIDIALCGAVELMASELPYYMFNSLGALCQAAEWPAAQQSRPFMRDRCGFVLSEGAALLVLESRQHAERRRASALGRVLGFAALCEAEKMTSSSRDGSKYQACMNAALADARCCPADIDHINTHGTSTQSNDSCEGKAVLSLFGPHLDRISLTANKSAIGHSLASSGAIEVVLSLLSLSEGVLLPTLNYRPEGAEFPELRFLSEAECAPIGTVLSNSFGFGGINSALVLGGA